MSNPIFLKRYLASKYLEIPLTYWQKYIIFTFHSSISNFFSFRIANKETEKAPPKLKKHKLIATTYAKRQRLNSDGRLSISIHSSYQDPVGKIFCWF